MPSYFPPKRDYPWWHNYVLAAASVFLCACATYVQLPGMNLMGVTPNWMLIWLVTWSRRYPVLVAVVTGVSLGLVQDALVGGDWVPTHALGLAIAGGVTAWSQRQNFMREDLISIALLVFVGAVGIETLLGIQFWVLGQDFGDLWPKQQRLALTSAVLSSLWMPLLYVPLNAWWRSPDCEPES
ncbi:MAG: rod shape-determining protein MreD [Oscillatoriales cyanobacterium SM2_2_1]|nr:rod shape-determining protein MreD [Oscillatoriales cyanobacterium SM2_2_1]